MGYVMVPVPEEHVAEAMDAILRIAVNAAAQAWSQEAVQAVWDKADEHTQTLLRALVKGGEIRGELPDEDAAAALAMSTRELLGLVKELNDNATRDSRPLLILVRDITVTGPGGSEVPQRVLTLAQDPLKQLAIITAG